MTKQKKGSVTSERVFGMKPFEADFSIASLFYFQSKMPDAAHKKVFAHEILRNMCGHSVTGLHRPPEPLIGLKKMARETVSPRTCSDNYLDKSMASRKSWVLSYGAKTICDESAGKGSNPYKTYYEQRAPYMFADKKTADIFVTKKTKLVSVEGKTAFTLKNLFKRKTIEEKAMSAFSENVSDFMGEPFAAAIHNYHEEKCLQDFQNSIDDFVAKVAPDLESRWAEQGLGKPFSSKQEQPIAA